MIRTRWGVRLLATLIAVVSIGIADAQHSEKTIRVGVYQNKPKIFIDENGVPSGFFIDLATEIAKAEGWKIEFLPGTWPECLASLEAGRIDLMPDVAYSPERAEIYDFNGISALGSWSQVFTSRKIKASGFPDLSGLKVAVLKGSIQQVTFEKYMHGFGVAFTSVPVDSFQDAFTSVADGRADAAIVNSFFGNYFAPSFGLAPTPIVFEPTSLFFATQRGRNPDLLEGVDRRLTAWLREPDSIYFTILGRWMKDASEARYRLPLYVFWIIGGIAGVCVLAFGLILLLRSQVRARTMTLQLANRALSESEKRYQLISSITSDYLFSSMVGADGRIVTDWVAGAFEAITGYAVEEYKARGGWRSTLHPDDLAVDDRDIETLRSGRVVVSEVRTVRKDGRTIWVQVYAHPVMDPLSGEFTGIYGAVKDITPRKQAEAANQAVRQQLFDIIDFLPDATFVVDENNTIIAWNRACEKLTEIKKEEALRLGQAACAEAFFGRRAPFLIDLLDAEDPGIEGRYEYFRREGNMAYAEAFIPKMRGGRGANIWMAAAPLLDQGNQRRGAIEVLRDITEQKRIEELIIARARAESADRLKSAFLATMSHELRTPLNSILGFTGILLMNLAGPLNPEQTKQLAMVQDSARHLLELINDVLDISKIEAGQMKFSRERFDMGSAIRKTIERVSPLAEKKGLSLTAGGSANECIIVGDQRRIEQVLMNLLSNAIKFTERGSVRVECRIESGIIVTRVIDTGIGIKQSDVDLIFKPFQQVDIGLTRQYEGTGLGLSICKGLVKAMGGGIWIESEWGKGSEFAFSLPLSEVTE